MAAFGKFALVLLVFGFGVQQTESLDFNKIANNLNIPGLNSTSIKNLVKVGLNGLRKLLGKNFNFNQIAKGTKIFLDNLQLNRANLRLGIGEARKLLRYLHGFDLDDRMKAWGLMVKYARLFESGLKNWKIEDLHLFESDILLSTSDIEDLIKEAEEFVRARLSRKRSAKMSDDMLVPHLIKKRKITTDKKGKWGRTIPWRFAHKFTPSEQNQIKQGLQFWEAETCLSFVQTTPTTSKDHLAFIKDGGCYSFIGKQSGAQHISIDSGCFNFGIIVHEIGHALGMWHEQSRPDRDLYVSTIDKNIEQGKLSQFQMRTWAKAMSIGVPYDYGSVMHYGRKDFSIGSVDTLSTKLNGYQQTIGQLRTASFYDVKLINYQYCSDLCGSRNLDWSKCDHDGYKNPRDCSRCKCPEGFKEPYCQQVQDSSTAECGRNELKATVDWTTLTSPGSNGRMTGPATCYWKITAPPGSNVRLEFLSPFSFPAPPFDSCTDYVEVRYRDMALTGPRFCGLNIPKDPFISEDHGTVLLLFRSTASSWNAGFKVRFRADSCNQCGPGSPAVQPACAKTVRYTCYGSYKCNWLGRKTCKRLNTCLETLYTCCPGYTRNGKTCTKK